ncbi:MULTISPECIES: hypothetical protein [unclassified Comamonas]|uniref:hypothetical protein n=1 Tax=unclassified Comamonas TaxID=2638500 RepID=UPI001EFB1865|nr:hypothetical protein [Comamonas sp. B21-038]ULR88103.1 hypothetical protein MJ205_16885 [Comamonas sp. B21-038]
MKNIAIGIALTVLLGEHVRAQVVSQTADNGTISISLNPVQYGGAITSLKVSGVETLDTHDHGRLLQASLFFNAGSESGAYVPCNGGNSPPWVNPQEAGDNCNRTSTTIGGGPGHVGSGEVNVLTEPLDWGGLGVRPVGFQIGGNHKLGPLPYMNLNQVARLLYTFKTTDQTVHPLTYLPWGEPNLGPFVPAIYFKASLLNRLYGLSMDGSTWTEVTSSVNAPISTAYQPSYYRFKAMAWATDDTSSPSDGWGVAIYGGWTTNQICSGIVTMTLPAQAGQCANYAAQRFPTTASSDKVGTNNISLLDQTLTTIQADSSVTRMPHIVVGNLDTIRSIINGLSDQGY